MSNIQTFEDKITKDLLLKFDEKTRFFLAVNFESLSDDSKETLKDFENIKYRKKLQINPELIQKLKREKLFETLLQLDYTNIHETLKKNWEIKTIKNFIKINEAQNILEKYNSEDCI